MKIPQKSKKQQNKPKPLKANDWIQLTRNFYDLNKFKIADWISDVLNGLGR